MSRGKASGYVLHNADVPIILGMQKRGDRDHDIAAWFGVNQGRIVETKEGKFGPGQPAPSHTLPPSGPPGIKGRRLREAIDRLLLEVPKGAIQGKAATILVNAIKDYDKNEA
jgi:hypothetical protein